MRSSCQRCGAKTDQNLPPTSYRPSPTAHRPSPTAHRPPPIAHRLPPIAHRLPPIAHRRYDPSIPTIGLSGFRRNATVAVAVDGRLAAVVEQERVTRVRGVGIRQGGFPADALSVALRTAGLAPGDDAFFAFAEAGIDAPGVPSRFDYRYAHAVGAFGTSSFDEALVVVCDRHATPELSAFHATRAAIVEHRVPGRVPAFATMYSGLARGLGFAASGDEHLVESLGRIGSPAFEERAAAIAEPSEYVARIAEWNREPAGDPIAHAADIATGAQRAIGRALVDVLRRLHAERPVSNLCVAGDLFYNSFFNTAVRESGVFERVFVPVNPGDPGVAAGCALAADDCAAAAVPTPFLGPGYSAEEIKAVLDNCKLVYHYADAGAIEQRVVDALVRGQLVAWFQGRMEYGPRALGNRSILASPFAAHVLENLNRFLKQRESYRTYGVSLCAGDLPRYFTGPPSSELMQYEFTANDPDLFRPLLVRPGARLRVQTVGEAAGEARLRSLLCAFGQASRAPVLVNTSFNGFHEPIVCSPRDAVRVFYGTGLDLLVIGNFVVTK